MASSSARLDALRQTCRPEMMSRAQSAHRSPRRASASPKSPFFPASSPSSRFGMTRASSQVHFADEARMRKDSEMLDFNENCATPKRSSSLARHRFHSQLSTNDNAAMHVGELRSETGKAQRCGTALLLEPLAGKCTVPSMAPTLLPRRGSTGDMQDLLALHALSNKSSQPTCSVELDDTMSTTARSFLQRRRMPVVDSDGQEDSTLANDGGSPLGANTTPRGLKTSFSSSALLARRSTRNTGKLAALDMQSQGGSGTPKKQLKPLVDIKQLAEGEKIFDRYFWKGDDVLQEEGFGGKVVICTPKGAENQVNSEEFGGYVMKIKSKASLKGQGSEGERRFRKAQRKMLNLPPHAGVLPLHEVLEDDSFYYVVMEKAKGGCLFASLVQDYSDGNMPVRALKNLMREVLAALVHIHKQGMLHRDIKPDNLVVQVYDESKSPGGRVKEVKLIDFDIADPDWEPMSPGKIATFAGTLRYSAPETFQGLFSQRSDLYSVGAILYLLVVGRLPYDDSIFELSGPLDNLHEIYRRMEAVEVDWSGTCWDAQPQGKDFCMWLMDFDLNGRPESAEEALTHPWITEQDV